MVHNEEENMTFAMMSGTPLFIVIVVKALLVAEGHFVWGVLYERGFRFRVRGGKWW